MNRIFFLPLLCFCLLAPSRRAAAQLSYPSGITNKSRVIVVEDPAATADDLQPVPATIQSMVDRALTHLTGKSNAAAAWKTIVATNDVVGLKVFSAPGQNSGTRPAVVAAVIQGLLAAGLPPRNIIVWDKRSVDLRLAGFFELQKRFGVRVEGVIETGYDEKSFYETAMLGSLSWSDLEFGRKGPGVGRKSFVSKLVTKDMTRIINITPLDHNNLAGVSGNIYSLTMGAVDNTTRFENDSDYLARTLPEIYALPVLGDKVVLNVVDALICQYEGQQRGLLQYSTVLNQLRVSRDPVALDVLSLTEINQQCESADVPVIRTNMDLYLNASLLELGTSDPKHIQIDTLKPSPTQ